MERSISVCAVESLFTKSAGAVTVTVWFAAATCSTAVSDTGIAELTRRFLLNAWNPASVTVTLYGLNGRLER